MFFVFLLLIIYKPEHLHTLCRRIDKYSICEHSFYSNAASEIAWRVCRTLVMRRLINGICAFCRR